MAESTVNQGVAFYDYFKGNCPNAYAYAFDESSGTALWTCDSGLNANYTLTFCPWKQGGLPFHISEKSVEYILFYWCRDSNLIFCHVRRDTDCLKENFSTFDVTSARRPRPNSHVDRVLFQSLPACGSMPYWSASEERSLSGSKKGRPLFFLDMPSCPVPNWQNVAPPFPHDDIHTLWVSDPHTGTVCRLPYDPVSFYNLFLPGCIFTSCHHRWVYYSARRQEAETGISMTVINFVPCHCIYYS
jgi:hypothetical protein